MSGGRGAGGRGKSSCRHIRHDEQRAVQKHITSSLGSIVTTVYSDAPPC